MECAVAKNGWSFALVQLVRVQLPAGFQTSEFHFEHGFIDRVIHRRDLRSIIAQLIDYTMS